eukprot:scaffold408_cov347-Pavlova_lutheri.AAC.24
MQTCHILIDAYGWRGMDRTRIFAVFVSRRKEQNRRVSKPSSLALVSVIHRGKVQIVLPSPSSSCPIVWSGTIRFWDLSCAFAFAVDRELGVHWRCPRLPGRISFPTMACRLARSEWLRRCFGSKCDSSFTILVLRFEGSCFGALDVPRCIRFVSFCSRSQIDRSGAFAFVSTHPSARVRTLSSSHRCLRTRLSRAHLCFLVWIHRRFRRTPVRTRTFRRFRRFHRPAPARRTCPAPPRPSLASRTSFRSARRSAARGETVVERRRRRDLGRHGALWKGKLEVNSRGEDWDRGDGRGGREGVNSRLTSEGGTFGMPPRVASGFERVDGTGSKGRSKGRSKGLTRNPSIVPRKGRVERLLPRTDTSNNRSTGSGYETRGRGS